MKRILMATDLSARSDRALQRAVALAHEFGTELKIIHVFDDSLLEANTLLQEADARAAIEEKVASLPLAKQLNITQELIRGLENCDIAARAEEFGADLVVLGIHRHNTRKMFQGTTVDRVVRYASLPVLVVKSAVTGPYHRVLVAADLSTHSQAAAAIAARLARRGEVYLVHAAHRPVTAFLGRDTQNQLIRDERARIAAVLDSGIQQLAAELGEAAPRIEIVLREGQARSVIREQVAALKPDLLALGTHARTGLAHAIIGSVAADLLADAPVDVLVVKAA